MMENSQKGLTSETPYASQHAQVPCNVLIVPSGRDVALQPEGRRVSRAHDNKNNDKDDEKADVKNTSDKLHPRNKLEGVDVHQSMHQAHGDDENGSVPSTSDITGMVDANHGLE